MSDEDDGFREIQEWRRRSVFTVHTLGLERKFRFEYASPYRCPHIFRFRCLLLQPNFRRPKLFVAALKRGIALATLGFTLPNPEIALPPVRI